LVALESLRSLLPLQQVSVPPRLSFLCAMVLMLPGTFGLEKLKGSLKDNYALLSEFLTKRNEMLIALQADNEAEVAARFSQVHELKNNIKKLQQHIRGGDYESFKKDLKLLSSFLLDHLEQQQKILEAKLSSSMMELEKAREKGGGEREMKLGDIRMASLDEFVEQLKLQFKTSKVIYQLFGIVCSSLEFFGEHQLFAGAKLVDKLEVLFHQAIRVTSNNIGLLFNGLLKTGKSTLVDTIIGDPLSPQRDSPMTAIPVVYTHDPDYATPVMVVPFFSKLNQMVEVVKSIILEKTKEKVIRGLTKRCLLPLIEKISSDALAFKEKYLGKKEIMDISFDLHDLFRLIALSSMDSPLLKAFDFSWNFDNMVTVFMCFPDLVGVGKEVKISVVDTPGIDESEMDRLNLEQSTVNLSSLCHFVTFTVSPTSFQSKANHRFKQLLERASSTSSIPVIIATQKDLFPLDQGGICEQLSQSFKVGFGEPFPLQNIFFVSAKAHFLGRKAVDFVRARRAKPSPKSPSEEEKKLAHDLAFFLGYSLDSAEEAIHNYEKMEYKAFQDRVQSLLKRSDMEKPLDLLLGTSLRKGGLLTSRLAIDHTVKASSHFLDYFRRIQEVYVAEGNRNSSLNEICQVAASNLKRGIKAVDSVVHMLVIGIQEQVGNGLDEIRANLKDDISYLVEANCNGELIFETVPEALVKVEETFAEVKNLLEESLVEYVEDEQMELITNPTSKIKEEIRSSFLETLNSLSKALPLFEGQIKLDAKLPIFSLPPSFFSFTPDMITSCKKKPNQSLLTASIRYFQKENGAIELNQDSLLQIIDTLAQNYMNEATLLIAQKAEKHLSLAWEAHLQKILEALEQVKEAIDAHSKVMSLISDTQKLESSFSACFGELDQLLRDCSFTFEKQ